MSRTALLDVNFLVALFYEEHIHHEAAHDWFSVERESGWATCPLTENGFVRQVSDAKFAQRYKALPTTTFGALGLLGRFCTSGHHTFWPDDSSLRELNFDPTRFFGHRHTTDIYLLALAVKNGGRLVTFDKSIPLPLLKDAKRENLEVLSLA